MGEFKLYDGELKFLNIIWDNEPLSSRKLVELCAAELGWKQSTTYTVLKKLSQKGIVQNVNCTVTSLVDREHALRRESASVVDRVFGGSLPGFIAAFINGRGISEDDAEEIRCLIEKYRKNEK